MYTLRSVIWDFNGTILDDLDLVVRSINTLLDARGLPQTNREKHKAEFGFPVDRYYQTLGFDLQQESFSELSREYHDHYLAGLAECPVHAGATELITHLHDTGIPQYVLSAMQQDLLQGALQKLDLHTYFDGVFGLDDLLARSKTQRGHALIAAHGLVPTETLYIGDTEHDVEVAHELGCVSVGLAVGHQAAGRFNPANTYLCRSFDELASCIASGGTDRSRPLSFVPSKRPV